MKKLIQIFTKCQVNKLPEEVYTVRFTVETLLEINCKSMQRKSVCSLISEIKKLPNISHFNLDIKLFHHLVQYLNIHSRCRIPECDVSSVDAYKTDWLPHAIPYHNGRPTKCLQFAAADQHTTTTAQYNSGNNQQEFCSVDRFNRSARLSCENQDFIYETDEITIAKEVTNLLLITYTCLFLQCSCNVKL